MPDDNVIQFIPRPTRKRSFNDLCFSEFCNHTAIDQAMLMQALAESQDTAPSGYSAPVSDPA